MRRTQDSMTEEIRSVSIRLWSDTYRRLKGAQFNLHCLFTAALNRDRDTNSLAPEPSLDQTVKYLLDLFDKHWEPAQEVLDRAERQRDHPRKQDS